MTSSKLKFRPSRINGKAGFLYIRVIHGRIVRQINLGYKIFPHEWKKGRVLIPEQKSERLHYLLDVQEGLRESWERLEAIVRRFKASGKAYTVEQIVNAFRMPDNDEYKLYVFAHKITKHLRTTGQVRLAETYSTSVNSFLRFRGEKGVTFPPQVTDFSFLEIKG